MTFNVLVTAPSEISTPVGAALTADFPSLHVAVTVEEDQAESHRADADVLVTIGHALTPEMVARMPRLRFVQALTSGTDHVGAALGARDVVLTSGRGAHGPQVAEMALLHMLVLKRDVRSFASDQRRRLWDPMRSNRSSLLYGKTVGIAGLGVIGQALAALCKAHGMTVVGISDAVRDAVGVDRYFVRAAVLDAVAELDFLVLALPLTSETEGMINAEVFRRMKSTAFLINVARGAIVDEDALVEAVAAGAIAGAGLDTFTIEPLPADSPLWDPDRVFITPHVGGRSDIYAQQIYPIVEHNLRAFLSGSVDEMINVVAR